MKWRTIKRNVKASDATLHEQAEGRDNQLELNEVKYNPGPALLIGRLLEKRLKTDPGCLKLVQNSTEPNAPRAVFLRDVPTDSYSSPPKTKFELEAAFDTRHSSLGQLVLKGIYYIDEKEYGTLVQDLTTLRAPVRLEGRTISDGIPTDSSLTRMVNPLSTSLDLPDQAPLFLHDQYGFIKENDFSIDKEGSIKTLEAIHEAAVIAGIEVAV